MDLALWRNISIVWLALQLFVLLIIPLALFYLLNRGMQFVHTKLPPLFGKAQEISGKVRTKTEEYSDKVAAPVIASHSKTRQARAVVNSLWQAGKREQQESASMNTNNRRGQPS